MEDRPFAVVTGASTGIGLELARCCAERGYDLLIAADEPLDQATAALGGAGVDVDAVQADLSAPEGVEELYQAAGGRPVDVLIANAGRGLGHAFLDQDWDELRRVVDTNITGTLYFIHRFGREMRERRQGRILIVGSIAGLIPGTFQAVYNGTKAFLDSFSYALRAELKDSGVTVTCLMPGPTETEFFERAELQDTKVGQQKKQPASEVAKTGFEAMLKGEAGVVSGWSNKLQAAISHILPDSVLAEMHRKQTAPGSAKS